ncbi:unnamed protein product [Cyprideis torosa]|uniref:Mitochondrial inner membrane protein Mpv17 n=1 Tax=Cyprideis torosa TaxID=163714 RepID=A0A7R8W3D7_9CRUS|nr:unnamed protein product [Cyprideis torosa]CAG0882778.1 unnamed protein product [Cyprideis torosa]
MLSKLWQNYNLVLRKYPMTVNMLQTGILCCAGDAISQKLIEHKPTYEWQRGLRFFCIGSFFFAPGIKIWYSVLDRFVGMKSTPRIVVTKVSLDQLFFAPVLLALFLSLMQCINGECSRPAVEKTLRADYWDVLATNWSLWPAVQLVNFYIVPAEFRILVVQIVALFWNSYLSYKTNVGSAAIPPPPKPRIYVPVEGVEASASGREWKHNFLDKPKDRSTYDLSRTR